MISKPLLWTATFLLFAGLTLVAGRRGPEPAEPLPDDAPTQAGPGPATGGPRGRGVCPAWATPVGPEVHAATGLPRRVLDRRTGIELVLVPPGTFRRGAPGADGNKDERPVHEVRITKPFYLGRHEVTQGQWHAALQMVDGVNLAPSGHAARKDAPVEDVSWIDIQVFLAKTGLRLPTEAEWEYAARAGETGERPAHVRGWPDHESHQPRPVDLTVDDANAWGLSCMFGNVREWCADVYDQWYYTRCAERSPANDPTGPADGSERVIRGTSYGDSPRECRFGDRTSADPRHRDRATGFRVARGL